MLSKVQSDVLHSEVESNLCSRSCTSPENSVTSSSSYDPLMSNESMLDVSLAWSQSSVKGFFTLEVDPEDFDAKSQAVCESHCGSNLGWLPNDNLFNNCSQCNSSSSNCST